MRILLLIPEAYTLLKTIQSGFHELGHITEFLNYLSFFKHYQNRLITKTIGLPHKVRKMLKIHDAYRKKINKIYLEHVYNLKPDMVLVYNDQYLTYQTAREIKKITKLAFYLGDSPFFLFYHPLTNLGMYLEADYVFTHDSFITESLKKVGQPNVTEIYFGYNPKVCYPKRPTEEEKQKYGSDVVMIGRLYSTNILSWTYKRLWFYHQFRHLNLKIFGHGWRKYQQEFPELLNKVIDLNRHLSFDEVNTIVSCSKVYPIDANPGIINGIHLRVFDCIGQEILPLPEYTKDLEKVFKDVEIPFIKDYTEAEKIAKYYIDHDNKRERINRELKQFVDENYTPRKAAEKILNYVFNKK